MELKGHSRLSELKDKISLQNRVCLSLHLAGGLDHTTKRKIRDKKVKTVTAKLLIRTARKPTPDGCCQGFIIGNVMCLKAK